jgi:hypothetical protein
VKRRHVRRPPVGSLDIQTLLSADVTTHNFTEGHDAPEKYPCPEKIRVTDHAVEPPDGRLETAMPPLTCPTAMHSEVDGHDTAVVSAEANDLIGKTRHWLGPPVGREETIAFPRSSTHTQNEAEGQEMAPPPPIVNRAS